MLCVVSCTSVGRVSLALVMGENCSKHRTLCQPQLPYHAHGKKAQQHKRSTCTAEAATTAAWLRPCVGTQARDVPSTLLRPGNEALLQTVSSPEELWLAASVSKGAWHLPGTGLKTYTTCSSIHDKETASAPPPAALTFSACDWAWAPMTLPSSSDRGFQIRYPVSKSILSMM